MSPNTVSLATIPVLLLLSACNQEPEPTDTPDAATTETEPAPDETEPVSILRPDVEAETIKPMDPEPQSYATTVGFPDGGKELDADAMAVLEQVRQSDQFAGNGAIVLYAHSDSAGTDADNASMSEERGLAVAEWLIAAGAEPRRIDVIVFGEQNPVQPNALPDGTPNETGRAANRRVEIEILASSSDAPENAILEAASEVGDEG
ncbi:OmpA family protein [uncultured Erythrobacter sp.]|uniref:OmpA family protein n=1 Tax=uncultured Erythrobacter sp. TaxID=263913 RepID=UPI002604ACE2|nr:OmpA family protein [uncultured Erythrobacter sp.]